MNTHVLLPRFLSIMGTLSAFVRESLAAEREAGRDGPATPGGFHVPSKVSLARTLIEQWLQEG